MAFFCDSRVSAQKYWKRWSIRGKATMREGCAAVVGIAVTVEGSSNSSQRGGTVIASEFIGERGEIMGAFKADPAYVKEEPLRPVRNL